MDNNNLQLEVDKLKKELETLKNLFYKDNFSNLQVIRKQTEFKGDIIFRNTVGDEMIIYEMSQYRSPRFGLELEGGDLWLDGELICDGGFRINQIPELETIIPDKTITISCDGVDYKIPIVAA